MSLPAAARRESESSLMMMNWWSKTLLHSIFSNIAIGLFSPGASVSAVYAPKAVEAGAVVIDNTSQFRYEDDVPLVVPEVNPRCHKTTF